MGLRELGVERGLVEVPMTASDPPSAASVGFERSVVVEDLDADGDLDALIAGVDGLPRVHLNDGSGAFEAGQLVREGQLVGEGQGLPRPDLFGVADLDGDELPDLVGQLRRDDLWFATNEGGSFGPAEQLPAPDGWRDLADVLALGDVDGDGWVAEVLVVDGPSSWLHTVQGPRASGQSPSRVHVGLGERERVERVQVRWPGGLASTALDVPTRRRVTSRAPGGT